MSYIDLKQVEGEVALDFVQTVHGNMEGFTWHEVEEAREAQGMIGHPTNRDFWGWYILSAFKTTPLQIQP
jgi:hypothetical protein